LYGERTGETCEDVQCVLARLFVEAGLNDRNGEDCEDSELAAGSPAEESAREAGRGGLLNR
jgi:hypothetical protein